MSTFKKYLSLIQEAANETTANSTKNVYNNTNETQIQLNQPIFKNMLSEFKNDLDKFKIFKSKQKKNMTGSEQGDLPAKDWETEMEIVKYYTPSGITRMNPYNLDFLEDIYKKIENVNVKLDEPLTIANLNSETVSSDYYGFFGSKMNLISVWNKLFFIIKQIDKEGNNFKIIGCEKNEDKTIQKALLDKDFNDFYNQNDKIKIKKQLSTVFTSEVQMQLIKQPLPKFK